MTQGIGLVMQGSGALGAYEVGALTRIYQAGYEPEIITGTSKHIMASGSLPPGFPPIELDGHYYWDGGLYDNTPIRSLLRILDDHQIAQMPIFLIELFCPEGIIHTTVEEAVYRMTELVFEDKFWLMLDGDKSAQHYSHMLYGLDKMVPKDSPMRDCEHYRSLMKMCSLSHIITVKAEHNALTGVVDFEPRSINERIKTGYLAADQALINYAGRIEAIISAQHEGHMTDNTHSEHKPHPEEKRSNE